MKPLCAGILLVLSLTLPRSVIAQWTDNQNAEFVLGQANFTDSGFGATATTMRVPHGVAIDVVNGKLYIVEQGNNRVMRFAYPIVANQPVAELVFGQPDFVTDTANTGGLGAGSLDFPVSAAVDDTGRLWVTDTFNNRVVWYDAAHTLATNQPSADGVFGQPDFVSNMANRGGSAAADTLELPIGLEIDDSGTLWVADHNNDRVLRYDNAAAKANGAAADGVLGQPDFVTTGTGLSATAFDRPYAMEFIGASMFLCDFLNNRVLRFDNAATKLNGAAADGVLGQPDFTSNTAATTASGLNIPHDVGVDIGGRLYVADLLNHRVLIFENAVSAVNGATADFVLGQPDFMTATQDVTQQGFSAPGCLDVDSVNGKLIVSELNSHRVLVFSASAPLPVELSAIGLE